MAPWGTPSSWSDSTIVVPVPNSVSLTTGLVIVTIDGKVPSNGLPFSLALSPGVITTVAGNGTGVYAEGGPAPATGINADDVVVDGLGNLYIAAAHLHRIFKVDPNDTITTIAGTGVYAYGGDGGQATAAQLNTPYGAAVDTMGNVFIADTANNRIRKVNAAGIITTIAGNGTAGFSGDGGPATNAQLSNPWHLLLDGQGNLLFSDSSNERVRKVNTAGVITTVAGNGTAGFSGDGGPATSAQLDGPQGLALDGQGNLFVADNWNARVRKVASSGIITTVAGSGLSGFGGDGGPATAAYLKRGVDGLALDGEGNLYIADPINQRIRRVGPDGMIDTVAGNGVAGFGGDSGLATNAPLNYPHGVATDGQGHLFIADTGNNRVRKVALPPPAPSVSGMVPTTGTAGSSVVITGSHFGASQGASTVTFNEVAGVPTSWGTTSISVPVPVGATSGSVVVTVGGVASNGINFTVTPTITSVSPTAGPVGGAVSISGTGFGVTQGTSTVTFNGVAAAPTSWSATLISVPVPAGATSGPVVVTVGGVASNGVSFTVGPMITSLLPIQGTVGAAVTISGMNFGSLQGTSAVTFNGAAGAPTSWSAASISVPVPAAATSGPVVVTVGGVASNGVSFTVTPTITSVSPTTGMVGTAVSISGTGFGGSQGTSTVTFNGAAGVPTSWSATSISVPVPAAATSGPVVVTVGGVASTGVSVTVTPTISGLSPTSGPTGANVTIDGTGFGATQGSGTVTFNGAAATPTSWTATSIAVSVPANATSGPVVVTVAGIASNGVAFGVVPQITGLSPTSGPVGTAVTVSGTGFGATQGTSTVTVNGTAATPTSWSDTSIAFLLPASATSGPVVVTVAGIAGNGVGFTVTPRVTSVSPTAGAVGAAVTVGGTSFGATQGTSTVSFNGTTATPTSWSDTSLVVPVPTGATSGPVVVTVGGFASNGVAFPVLSIQITYPAPGAILNQPDTVVMGQLAPGLGEVSVLVNGRPAMVNGQGFAINAIALGVGTTVITATLKTLDGVEVQDSVSVNTTAQDAYTQVTGPIDQALTPMSAQFTVDGVLPAPVTQVALQITGPGNGYLSTTVFPFTTTTQLQSVGIYLFTVTVTTASGSYEGRMAINVMDPISTEALLYAKWDGVKAATAVGDIEGALAYFLPDSQDRYRSVFLNLGANLSPILESMETVHLLSIRNNQAEAEAIRTEEGVPYSYPVIYRRDANGIWKFQGF